MYTQRFITPEPSSLKEPIAIIGLPGIGNVGRVAAETLVDVINAQPMLRFYSDDFPARVFVRDGISYFPSSVISLYRSAPDEPHDLMILSADFQPATPKGVFEYADFITKEFNKLGVQSIFAMAAYESRYQDFFERYPNPPRIFTSSNSRELLDEILGIPGTVATEEGVINGANGVIPAWASSLYSIDGACLLGETLGVIKVDYRASREVLDTIRQVVKLKAQFDILDEAVEKVVEFIEWAKTEIASRGGTDSLSNDRPSDRYIG